MELDLNLALDPKELEDIATRYRENIGYNLTQSLQEHLNEVLGPDVRIGVRVEVESVALRKTGT